MSLHQSIFTSCMRGINGISDGQQLFSHDAAFTDPSSDEIRKMYSYQAPATDTGVQMTDDLVGTMPKKFSFKRLSDGRLAFALSTYLGRDYMGDAGRYGNYVTHVILSDGAEGIASPNEYYLSPSFITKMEFSEVNNPEPPDYLPSPVLEPSDAVSKEKVAEFLSFGDRINIFANIFHAVLRYETEKKRVLICDSDENMIMWISAVIYALPKASAFSVDFSTYEFDPWSASSVICGVRSKNTRFDRNETKKFYVFDILNNSYPKLDKDHIFFAFLTQAMKTPNGLDRFKDFLENGYDYAYANTELYSAYRVFSMPESNINELSVAELKGILSFADRYAKDGEYIRLTEVLTSFSDFLQKTSVPSFMSVAAFCVSRYGLIPERVRDDLQAILCNRILLTLDSQAVTQDGFDAFYNELDAICREKSISIASFLMISENRKRLFAVIKQDSSSWKKAFAVKTITEFVKDKGIQIEELSPSSPIGSIYSSLVRSAYGISENDGIAIVKEIIGQFDFDSLYLVNMTLNTETMLLENSAPSTHRAVLWSEFCQKAYASHFDEYNTLCGVLFENGCYDNVFLLYSMTLDKIENADKKHDYFLRHYENAVLSNSKYAEKHKINVLETYYNSLSAENLKDSLNRSEQVFDIISKERLNVSFAEKLTLDILSTFSLGKPSKNELAFIDRSFEYIHEYLHISLDGRLALFTLGERLRACKKATLRDELDFLAGACKDGKAELDGISEKEAEKYFNRFLPDVCEICETTGDIQLVYSLFKLPEQLENILFRICAKSFMRQCRSESFTPLCNYLAFVFRNGGESQCTAVGKVLKKLNKEKLAKLDSEISDMLSYSESWLDKWNSIKAIAEKPFGLLDVLSRIFGRK